MKLDKYIVTEDSVAPAGKSDECFWCQAKIGEQHKEDCTNAKRTVMINVSIDTIIDMPFGWSKEDIEFYLNESSSCATNILRHLVKLEGKLKDTNSCLCDSISCKYLREAAAGDEHNWQFYVKEVNKD